MKKLDWEISKNQDGTLWVWVKKQVFTTAQAEHLSRDLNLVASGRMSYIRRPDEGFTLNRLAMIDAVMEEYNEA